ncbi:hypothetical protein ACFQH5_19215 [Halomonas salifodinae]|uniref:Uncharacterized protein n=1 Tax=Halomonas salifodinae TaxID=438745 RepID=A0ABW2F458_9GAMM
MLEKRHVIAHEPSAVTNGEFPLSIDEADRHLGYLEADIENYFYGKEISVSVEIKGREAYISLKTILDHLDLDNELNKCLIEINSRTNCLAFVKVG